jgi:hypothetical protein
MIFKETYILKLSILLRIVTFYQFFKSSFISNFESGAARNRNPDLDPDPAKSFGYN